MELPHDHCVMVFDANTDPEDIRNAITPTPAAERELAKELLQRRNALMDNHSMAVINAVILRRWRYDPGENLARWTKQELANELVDGEDGRERYEAYGRVPLHDGRPAPNSRPLCGCRLPRTRQRDTLAGNPRALPRPRGLRRRTERPSVTGVVLAEARMTIPRRR
ncbi:hypothetical protein [Streptomyces sp. NPDC006971]|uniref:hypothetical protein n=1 Tax=Streptomyces sp. NPDC006971 TaxID=3154784 RepID=UPI0033C3FF02